ncbi:MAG TPA: hypothetical protein VHD83_05725 [Puia sp.]|nr:hypothetical protein [Puia sp.]
MMRRIPWYIAFLLFFYSLWMPAFDIGDDSVIGLAAFIYGGAWLDKSIGWSWLANPLFIVCLFSFFHRKRKIHRMAVYIAVAAFLLSLSFLLVKVMPGDKAEVVSRKAGYWVWLGSMGALVVATVLNNREPVEVE